MSWDAIYVLVSTDTQTVENQVQARRDERPGLDLMLNDAKWRKIDVVMVWAIDRLRRSLVDLLNTIKERNGPAYISDS